MFLLKQKIKCIVCKQEAIDNILDDSGLLLQDLSEAIIQEEINDIMNEC